MKKFNFLNSKFKYLVLALDLGLVTISGLYCLLNSIHIGAFLIINILVLPIANHLFTEQVFNLFVKLEEKNMKISKEKEIKEKIDNYDIEFRKKMHLRDTLIDSIEKNELLAPLEEQVKIDRELIRLLRLERNWLDFMSSVFPNMRYIYYDSHMEFINEYIDVLTTIDAQLKFEYVDRQSDIEYLKSLNNDSNSKDISKVLVKK